MTGQRLVEIVDAKMQEHPAVVLVDRQAREPNARRIQAVVCAKAETVDSRLADACERTGRCDAIVEVGVEQYDAVLVIVRVEEGVVHRRPFHVVPHVRAGIAFQAVGRLEMANPEVADHGQVTEGQVEIGDADTADGHGRIIDVGDVLDVRKVGLGSEVDEPPGRAIRPQACAPQVRAVLQMRHWAGANE